MCEARLGGSRRKKVRVHIHLKTSFVCGEMETRYALIQFVLFKTGCLLLTRARAHSHAQQQQPHHTLTRTHTHTNKYSPDTRSITACTCPLFDPNSAIRRVHPNLSTFEFIARLHLRAKQIDVKSKFGFLFEGFEKHGICPYWEVTIITIRKILIMGIATGLRTVEVRNITHLYILYTSW